MSGRQQRPGPPVLPSDVELRTYYRLWLGEQAVITGERPATTFHEWRRQWITDQPKHLAAWRAEHRRGAS